MHHMTPFNALHVVNYNEWNKFSYSLHILHLPSSGCVTFFFFFLSNWDGASPGVGALRKLRTLHIGSGGTGSASANVM